MPFDITPDPDGNLTPIAPSGSDPLTAASALGFLQRLADMDAYLRRPTAAWFSLDNIATNENATMDLLIKSSYPSGDWSLQSDAGVQVPVAGLYRVDFVALIDATDDTSYLEVACTVGELTGTVQVGLFQGFRHGDNAAPAHVVGWLIVPILDPPNERIWFEPKNGTAQTPQTEGATGDLHKIIITKIGDLP